MEIHRGGTQVLRLRGEPGTSGSGCIWPVRYCSVLIAERPEGIHEWTAVWDNGNRPLLTDRLVRKEYSDNRNR